MVSALNVLIFVVSIALAFLFGLNYPAAQEFTPAWYVDVLVAVFMGVLISRAVTLTASTIQFRLRLRRAMKEAAQ
jgi:hypothetical protein